MTLLAFDRKPAIQDLSRVQVFHSMKDARSVWLELEQRGVCTAYQSYEWCRAWMETIGAAIDAEILIIVLFDENARPVLLLPLCRYKKYGLQFVRWISSDELTYGSAIFDQEFFAAKNNAIGNYWPEIVCALGRFDVIHLNNQPETINGIDNPLAPLFSNRSANCSYAMELSGDYDELYRRKRSSSSRRGNAKRDRKLEKQGTVFFGLPTTGQQSRKIIGNALVQLEKRLGERGIHNVVTRENTAFLNRLSDAVHANGETVLLPYYLSLDGELLATMIGVGFGGSYWAMIATITEHTDLHKLSPGDNALRQTIRACCKAGYKRFDFATGDSAYKKHWASETIELHETILTNSLAGRLISILVGYRVELKRFIKSNPALKGIAFYLRWKLKGKN